MSQSPIIGLDLSCLSSATPTGVERYALHLARHLPAAMPEARVVWIGRFPFDVDAQASGANICRVATTHGNHAYRRKILPSVARELHCDLLHSPLAHVPRGAGFVVSRTVHDIPLLHPECDERLWWWDRLRLRQVYRDDVPTVAVSRATLHDLETLAPQRRTPALVVPLGVEPPGCEDESSRHTLLDDLPERLVLVLGAVRRRRRPGVVRLAMQRLGHDPRELAVFWVGPGRSLTRAGGRLRFCGWQPDAVVQALRRRAAVVLCPSVLEGFGLPLLEGLAAGVPVVAARNAASLEIGGPFVRFYDGDDPAALATALAAALTEPRDPNAAAAGVAHARAFTWERTAALHADFFRSLLAAERLAAPCPRQGV